MGANTNVLANYEMNKLTHTLRILQTYKDPITKEKLLRAMERAEFNVNRAAADLIIQFMTGEDGAINIRRLNNLLLTLATTGQILDVYDMLALAMAEFQDKMDNTIIEHDMIVKLFQLCNLKQPPSLTFRTCNGVTPGRLAILMRNAKLL